MSSSTALLPKDRKKEDHPIFLRICHSPWSIISQQVLISLRGITSSYMVVSFAMILDYELRQLEQGWMTLFEFSNVPYLMQALYHVIAFSWTFMHFHYPHHGSQEQTPAKILQRILSPPRQNSTTKNRTWFSIFYFASNSFPFTSILIHWVVMVPLDKTSIPVDQIFHLGWPTTFFVLTKWGIGGLIAIIETLFFNSVRVPDTIGPYIAGCTSLSAMILGWQYIGYIFADKFSYFFLDHNQVSWEWVVSSWFLFILANNFCRFLPSIFDSLLTIIVFFFTYGLASLRQILTKKGESKKSGYQILPQ